MNNSKFCVISAPVATRSGYGDHSKDLVRSLIKNYPDWDIKIISTKWGGCPMDQLVEGRDDDIISRLWFQPQLPQQPDVWVQCTVPNEFQPVGKFSIGITAGIETTACDPSWIEGCNRMDLVIVPSNHAKAVFEQSQYEKRDQQTGQSMGVLKLEKPVETLIEGLDLNVFKKVKDAPKDFTDEMKMVKEPFNYLVCGHWLKGDLGQDRKDIGMTIKIFLETFKNRPKQPGLILKTSGAGFSAMDKAEILEKIEAIKRTVQDVKSLPNIYLLHGDMTPEEINALYNHPKVSAMVSLTKGEGWGRPLAEFARTGKPIIASNWSGHTDFLNPKYHEMLPGQLTDVHPSAQWKGVINEGTKWFTANYQVASGIMLDMFSRYKVYAEKSRGSGHYMKTNFSLEVMDEKFKEIVDRHMASTPQQVGLSLPRLKKVGKTEAPKKLQLPKLKKVTE
jgi:glycosyltransferase involved in cell wall biosynthesis